MKQQQQKFYLSSFKVEYMVKKDKTFVCVIYQYDPFQWLEL